MDNPSENKKNCKFIKFLSDIIPYKEGAFFKLKKNYEDKDEVITFKYIEKQQLNHDTYIFRYALPENTFLGLELGTHLAIKEKIHDEEKATKRKYTPVSWNLQQNYFDLLIKIYHPTSTFPQGGRMTQFLHKMPLNTDVHFIGPLGKCIYYGDGEFKITNKKTKVTITKVYKHVCMIAGGTGITPFYQSDILLREELDAFVKNKNFNFKLFYTLDHVKKILKKPAENWTQGKGYVSREIISQVFPQPGEDVLNLLCGPSAMCKKLVMPMLVDMGYSSEDMFKF